MAQDSPNIDSLFDFIYLDRNRLSSYSAQLSDLGTLTSVKSVSNSSDRSIKNLNLGLPKLLEAGTIEEQALAQGLERNFDTWWMLPLNVMGMLQEHDLISTDLENANYGQLVLIEGSIRFVDLRLLRDNWKHIGKVIASAMPDMTASHKRKKQEQAESFGIIADFASTMPHLLSLRMISGEHSTWSTLEPDNMVINPFDLMMKHGSIIAGTWHMIGLLDAKPYDDVSDGIIPSNMGESGIEYVMSEMVGGLRGLMGRNSEAYGITPLAIFRKTGPN